MVVVAEDREGAAPGAAEGGERLGEGARRSDAFHGEKVTGQEDEVGFPGDELCQAAPESADWLPWAEVRIGDLQNPERPLGKDARSTSPISFDRYP